MWPAGVEVMVAPQARVAPVAPVNPPAPDAAAPSPGVINAINPALQAQASAGAQSDPSQGSGADNSSRDWTLRKEEAFKVPEKEELPKEPLSEVLSRHIASVWSASARVVEIFMQNHPAQSLAAQQQAQTPVQATNRQVDPLNAPGDIAKEVLTYSPTQIKEPGKAE
ncbi:hypothetical protein DW355_01095 [Hylemonella gracilis]|uniref:Uncharacterized protein n=1 Tax=Hylemonella gracilis TaxID=80880 RepID=A0A4P6UHL4_9BURK|nr:hypothetical protein DW355_01095 [Hylemonella gracilis]